MPSDRPVSETTPPDGLDTSLRMYPDRDHRVGMRSALMDASARCDAIAANILLTGRRSKRRDDLAAVARRCANEIAAMRDRVEVPCD